MAIGAGWLSLPRRFSQARKSAGVTLWSKPPTQSVYSWASSSGGQASADADSDPSRGSVEVGGVTLEACEVVVAASADLRGREAASDAPFAEDGCERLEGGPACEPDSPIADVTAWAGPAAVDGSEYVPGVEGSGSAVATAARRAGTASTGAEDPPASALAREESTRGGDAIVRETVAAAGGDLGAPEATRAIRSGAAASKRACDLDTTLAVVCADPSRIDRLPGSLPSSHSLARLSCRSAASSSTLPSLSRFSRAIRRRQKTTWASTLFSSVARG